MPQGRADVRFGLVFAAGTVAATLSIGAAAPVALAGATETTIQMDIPLAGTPVTNLCNGDVLTLVRGDLHLAMHIGQNAAGGALVSGAANTQGVEGVDAQGIRYREIGVGTEGQVFTSSGGSAVTGTDDVRLVSQTAAEPNLSIRLVFHVTTTPDGTETASVENGSATCQT
jgi:hypothetical protein